MVATVRGVPDPIFADPRLVEVYDAFDDDRSDLDAYLAIADELDAHDVVDIGCGTGTFALLLAASGRTVTGVDPAEASLAVARRKPNADAVMWVTGDATHLPALGVDLVTMTGNVAQVFLTDEDWTDTLHAVRRVLRPGGHLVFETRRPEARAWADWAGPADPVLRDVPGVGTVRQRTTVTTVALPLVTFRHDYTFVADGSVVSSDSTLRFRSRVEVEASLTACGFAVAEVREAPDRPGKEYVFLAERPVSAGG